jgi:hypothetical protein
VRVVVEVGVDRGVIETEVGAEIDDLEAVVQELTGIGSCRAVGQGKEGEGCPGGRHCGHVGFNESEFCPGMAVEAGKDLIDPLSGMGARGHRHHLGARVAEDQAQ